MRKNTDIHFNKKAVDEIVRELWDNASFNPGLYELIEEIGMQLKTHKSISTQLLDKASFKVSTLRNRFVINDKEQDKLSNTVVAFFGLSVGSHAALTWMMESRATTIKISDPDTISPSNLNRLRFGWNTLGKYKVDVLKEQLLSINPIADIRTFNSKKINTIEEIILENPKVNLIVDEMDDVECKVMARKLAKMKRIPLLMATDVGDNVFLDVERYDQDPQPEYFLGRVKDIDKVDFSTISINKIFNIIKDIVGFEHNSENMLESLLSIGRKIKTQPQVASASVISGGIVTTAIKKIILGEKVISGRYYIDLDELLDSSYFENERKIRRTNLARKLKEKEL